MAQFNPDFWEVATDCATLDRTPAEAGLWYETETDRERRHALNEFFSAVLPVIRTHIDTRLTDRQREILHLYYFCNKSQEDIAEILSLTQSTVSRHLFGTVRNGRKVGGAIPKLKKIVERDGNDRISEALGELEERFAATAVLD
jgi:predicted transcriptional regulator